MSDLEKRLELIYEESIRALEQQATALDNLRTRAGVLFSGAAITSGLFGSQILRDGEFGCWTWVALGAFVLCAVGAFGVLWPSGEWYFVSNAGLMHKVWVDAEDVDAKKMMREAATFNQENWNSNRDRLKPLQQAFRFGSLMLGVEVVAWLIDLGTR